MQFDVRIISSSQLCELLGVDPQRFLCVERVPRFRNGALNDRNLWQIVLEPDDTDIADIPAVDQGR